jgi:membrane-associated phospholipid phosphatase
LNRISVVLLACAALPAAACVAPDFESRITRHAEGAAWSGAVGQTLDDPKQWGTGAFFVALTPVLHAYDHSLSSQAQQHHPITGTRTIAGDSVMGGLAVVSAGLAGWNWWQGDHAQSLEVAAESFALTGLETEIIKKSVQRRRPNHGQPTSFPSGHSSFSFAASTFLARSIWDADDSHSVANDLLGFACYVPAAWVGMNRIEAGRHFPSDVAFGAALGILTTNLIWDAHYGDAAHDRPGIFPAATPEHGVKTSLAPLLLDDGVGLVLQFRF